MERGAIAVVVIKLMLQLDLIYANSEGQVISTVLPSPIHLKPFNFDINESSTVLRARLPRGS